MASQYRLKRGPAIGLVLLVGVVGALLLARSSLKPSVDVAAPLTVPAAYDGTTYGFDGLVCVSASSLGAGVRADDGDTGDTRVGLRPPRAPVTVAFPVRPDAVVPLRGAHVDAGDALCTRLLVAPHGQGTRQAAPVTLHLSYGPFGLLRTSRTVRPPVTFTVTGTGTDPRAADVAAG